MAGQVTATATLRVGLETFLNSVSPTGGYGVVFEDDGETGYFYGLKLDGGTQAILDALHVYNAKDVRDRDRPSLLEIAWTPEGRRTALLINHYPHAVFDFISRRACCRTGFPPANGDFTDSHQWDDAVWKLFADPAPSGSA